MKRKLFITILTISLLLGSAQVLAEAILDTDILTIIEESIAAIRDRFASDTVAEVQSLEAKYDEKVVNYVEFKKGEIYAEFEKIKNNEVNRADNELNSYYELMKGEANQKITDEIEKAKGEISSQVDKEIEQLKKHLKNQFKEKLNDLAN